MNIDFPPPSKGTYNNAGSSRRLADYCEHEDLERMEQGIYTEGFFNLTDDNIYKSQVIKDIDSNIGQLLNTEYAKSFNKGLSAKDIKFYGKIHFSRDRSNNKLNMHCHLIVSRKDQTNKKKLSPLTNHKNTKKGIVKGGFDRKNLFQQAEQGFDKLFSYKRELTESFEYYNTMKNGSISDQLNMQKREMKETAQIQSTSQNIVSGERKKEQTIALPDVGLSSVLGILTPGLGNGNDEQSIKRPKKKKSKRGLRK